MRLEIKILSIVLLGSATLAQAQSYSGRLIVSISKTIGYFSDGKDGAPEYRHWFAYNEGTERVSEGGPRAEWHSTYVYLTNETYTMTEETPLPSFTVSYRAYEFDGGNNNDDAKIGPAIYKFYPLNYDPGVHNKVYLLMYFFDCTGTAEWFYSLSAYENRVSQLRGIASCTAGSVSFPADWIYGAELDIYYTPPKPILSVSGVPSQKCLNDDLTLTTAIDARFKERPVYSYQYQLDNETRIVTHCVPNPDHCDCDGSGNPLFTAKAAAAPSIIDPGGGNDCCYEPEEICTDVEEEIWRNLPQSAYNILSQANNAETISVEIGDIPAINNYLKTNNNLNIRFKARANSNGTYGDFSLDRQINVSAAAPTFNVSTVVPSCDRTATGEIHLSNVHGLGSYKYYVQTSICTDPEDDACITAAIKSGTFSGGSFTITEVPNEVLYVYVANVGGTKGNCASYKMKEVPAIPKPVISSVSPEDVTCPEEAGGSALIEISNGKDGSFDYSIIPNVGAFDDGATNRIGVFTNLPANEYTLIIQDECEETASENFIIYQPEKVEAEHSPQNPTCFNQPNGKIEISASYNSDYGDFITSGSGSGIFNFELLDDADEPVAEAANVSQTDYTFTGIAEGTYTLRVSDAEQPTCSPYEETVIIDAPEALGLNIANQKNISCFQAKDGQIKLSGLGGFGKYIFKITNLDSLKDFTTSDGTFSNLPPGEYEVSLQNDLPGCTDQFVGPNTVLLTQPEEMILEVQPVNITCYAADNGSMQVAAQGLLPDYSFEWTVDGLSYRVGDQTKSMDIDGLFPGEYQLTVTNANGCRQTAQSFTLKEPDPLAIEAINIDRPECFGDIDGQIVPVVSGGWEGYTYYFSNDSSIWTPYKPDKQFGPGKYWIKVVDYEGCKIIYPEILDFKAPDAPLALNLSLNSNNGYAVSCYGGENGVANLAGTGGIAFDASTYLYAFDDSDFSTNATVMNLGAGTHNFYLKDANGCIVEQSVTLSAPDSLELGLVSKNDVKCYGDFSGSIDVEASGGVAQYDYNINESQFNAQPSFDSLSSGLYHIEVRDKNGCKQQREIPIAELNEPITIASEIQDASCFSYADGTIHVAIDGGAEPYQYQWSTGADSAYLAEVPNGDYTLTVTDAENCQATEDFTIDEPVNFEIPGGVTLCQGQSYTLDATYPLDGTQYLWTAENGFVSNKSIVELTEEGVYTAEVILPNGCVMTDQFKLERSDVLFDVNFLAASEIEVGDTLVIVDVTTPSADSVEWKLGGDMKVLDPTAGHPQVIYDQPGQYDINFTAYHGGCVDVMSKSVTVLEKGQKPDEGRIYFGETGIDKFKLYPNPTQGKFEIAIKLHQTDEVFVEIYNTYGYPVKKKYLSGKDFYLLSFDISTEKNGVYLVRVKTSGEERLTKVVLNK